MEKKLATGKKKWTKKEIRILQDVMLLCGFILLSAGLIFGALYLVDGKIDQMETRIAEETQNTLNQELVMIRAENETALHALGERMDSLRLEVETLGELLANADETLGTSNNTSRELNERIEDLDQQLQDLEESLRILSQRP